jgi:hypothetical protein
MSTEEALVIIGIAFVIGFLAGLQAACSDRQTEVAFLASHRGVGLRVSSRPSITYGTKQ